jgi:ABC-type antimicrobial peptide transport system permease subunit
MDARFDSLKEGFSPTVYIPYAQDPAVLNYVVFEARTVGDPLALAGAVRRLVNEVSPRAPVFKMTTQSEQIDRTISQERSFAKLCSCFAFLALAIACAGVYGTMACSVSRRTNEIGIRMALGAMRRRIAWMVLREVLCLAGVGIVAGLTAAWTAARFLESYLFGIRPRDTFALFISAGALALAALLAGYAPARRASRIDPVEALRHE